MEIIYRGIFYGREDTKWEVRILREDNPPASVGVLDFAYDEPLEINWKRKSKEEVVCGSTATLTLMSPGDRTYVDLYSERVGEVRLDVLKNNMQYWRGTLDPEFYEEPYSTLEGYEVKLTFSDFGVMDRMPYALAGLKTLCELLDYCLGSVGLSGLRIDEHLISTKLESGTPHSLSLSDLTVRSDNFYDEDGEANTLEEVLKGVLQPLGLKIVQRGGAVWVYDLNGLYERGGQEKVEWMGEDQMLGVDVVYNNARVTWSPYVQEGVLTDVECYVKDTDPNVTALNMMGGLTYNGSKCWSYHYSGQIDEWVDASDCGFTLWTDTEGKNATLQNEMLRFFKIVPQEDGDVKEGVAVKWPGVRGYRGDGAPIPSFLDHSYGPGWVAGWFGSGVGSALWKSQDVWLPPVDDGSAFRLKIALEMLMDCRFNPFEKAENIGRGYDQKTWSDQWNARGNFVYIPVTLKWQPDGSDQVYCWTNQGVVSRSVLEQEQERVQAIGETLGSWEPYDVSVDEDPQVYGYLCWYQPDDRKEKAGVLGFRKNRPAINPHTGRLSTALMKVEDGQYVPYPTVSNCGGKLWLEVRSEGWILNDGDARMSRTEAVDSYGLWSSDKTCWCLMGLPEISVVHARQFDAALDDDDVEYKGILNSNAKEDIEIETICGTAAGGRPFARGAYFWRGVTGLYQVNHLTRAGRTSQVEELLIGTLYSQFAERKAKLNGTTTLPPSQLTAWWEAMQDGKRFVMTECVEDVRNETAECEFVELRPDEYDKRI